MIVFENYSALSLYCLAYALFLDSFCKSNIRSFSNPVDIVVLLWVIQISLGHFWQSISLVERVVWQAVSKDMDGFPHTDTDFYINIRSHTQRNTYVSCYVMNGVCNSKNFEAVKYSVDGQASHTDERYLSLCLKQYNEIKFTKIVRSYRSFFVISNIAGQDRTGYRL